jgi:SNF family Na+-dependent transporter
LFQAGSYWLTLVDAYGASGIALLFIVFFEVVGLSWGYGAERVHADMTEALGFRPCYLWVIAWKFVSPAVCAVRVRIHGTQISHG